METPIPEVLTKFNPFAMIHPRTEEEMLSLLNEANSLLDDLTDHMEAVTKRCESSK
jgi:hypothetical protein